MTRPTRISYGVFALTLVLVGWLHLAVPLLAVLFSCFALNKLHFARNRWLAVLLFLIVVVGVAYGGARFIKAAVVALPTIAESSIPSVIAWAKAHDIEMPFTDYDSLKAVTMDTVTEQVHYMANVANFARGATRQFVFLIIGIVVAISIFLNSQLDLDRTLHQVKNNLYSLSCEEITARFSNFYQSFAMVMGAQISISAINAALTAIFVIAVKLPHVPVVVGVTFLCGLLPIIGNLISNVIIVCLAFTVSPKLALAAIVFLVVIHKMEYFLNSKIIGVRIRNPVWLTLLGLIIGERLMGIPGMILAPVVLNYIRMESARIEIKPEQKLDPAPVDNI